MYYYKYRCNYFCKYSNGLSLFISVINGAKIQFILFTIYINLFIYFHLVTNLKNIKIIKLNYIVIFNNSCLIMTEDKKVIVLIIYDLKF